MNAQAAPTRMNGLGAVEDAIYRACLQHGPLTQESLHHRLNDDQTDTRHAPVDLDGRLTHLIDLGLIRVDDGVIDVMPPRATLQNHADRLDAAAESIRQRAKGWGELWQQYREYPPYLEVLEGEDTAAAFQRRVLENTTGELAGMQVRPASSPDRKPKIVPGFFEAIDRGVQFKIVYGVSVLRDPLGLSSVQECIARGEDARVFPDVPLNLRISDGKIGIISVPGESRGRRSAVIVHPSGLLDSLIRLFDSYWRMSVPIATDSEPVVDENTPDKDSRQLLAYLSAGLTDESIARELAVSERTVGRRVARLQELLGAHSRFQLGCQAVRRGWI